MSAARTLAIPSTCFSNPLSSAVMPLFLSFAASSSAFLDSASERILCSASAASALALF